MSNETTWELEDHREFAADMESAGLKVEAYCGRFFWYGPAVRVDDIQDALSATQVKCQWDNMGLGYIVYPTVSAPRPKTEVA